MAARVQGNGQYTDSTSSHLTPSITVTAGSLISVRISAFFTSPTFVASDCTKNSGTATIGAVTLDRTQADANEQAGVWSAIVTGSGTLVMAVATPAGTYGATAIDEFSGSWDSTRVEAVNSAQFTTSTSPSSGNATSAGAAVFVSALAVDVSAVITATPGGSGWATTFGGLDGTAHAVGTFGYKVAGSGGTEAASWTITGGTPVTSSAIIVAYKEAGGGGGSTDGPIGHYDGGIPAAYFADIGFSAIYGHQQLGIPLANRDSQTVAAASGGIDGVFAFNPIGAAIVAATVQVTGAFSFNPVGASRVVADGSQSYVFTFSPVGAARASADASLSGVLNMTGVGASSAQASADGTITITSSFGPVGASTASANASHSYTSSFQPVGASRVAADGSDSNVFSMTGVGAASTGVVAANGSIAGALNMQGAAAIVVSSAGSMAGALDMTGVSPRTASRRSDGPRPRRALTDDADDLMELAALLVPLISKGGPLWVH